MAHNQGNTEKEQPQRANGKILGYQVSGFSGGHPDNSKLGVKPRNSIAALCACRYSTFQTTPGGQRRVSTKRRGPRLS